MINTVEEREKLKMFEGHTPGPWMVRENLDGTPRQDSRDGYIVDRADPYAGKPFVTNSWILANAYIFAAAPDMKETILKLCDVLDAKDAEIDKLKEALRK